MSYADTLRDSGDEDLEPQPVLGDGECTRLQTLARRMKGKRLFFFNFYDGVKLRLAVKYHEQRQLRGVTVHCALCGNNEKEKRRPRSTYKCNSCDVHLCTKTRLGERKTCWTIWHSANTLVPRLAPLGVVRPPTGSLGSAAPPLADVPAPLNPIGESGSEDPSSGSFVADDDVQPSGAEGPCNGCDCNTAIHGPAEYVK